MAKYHKKSNSSERMSRKEYYDLISDIDFYQLSMGDSAKCESRNSFYESVIGLMRQCSDDASETFMEVYGPHFPNFFLTKDDIKSELVEQLNDKLREASLYDRYDTISLYLTKMVSHLMDRIYKEREIVKRMNEHISVDECDEFSYTMIAVEMISALYKNFMSNEEFVNCGKFFDDQLRGHIEGDSSFGKSPEFCTILDVAVDYRNMIISSKPWFLENEDDSEECQKTPRLAIPTISQIIRYGIDNENIDIDFDEKINVDSCISSILENLINYEFDLIQDDEPKYSLKGVQMDLGDFVPYDNVDDDAHQFIHDNKKELEDVGHIMIQSCGFSEVRYDLGEDNRIFIKLYF